jgi:hypothetical protein
MAGGRMDSIVPAGALDQLVATDQLLRLGAPLTWTVAESLAASSVPPPWSTTARCSISSAKAGQPAVHTLAAAAPSGFVPIPRISSMYFTTPS